MKNVRVSRKIGLWVAGVALALLLFFSTVALWLSARQEALVQELLTSVNAGITGSVRIGSSRIALFANFPYISIDLKSVAVYESKDQTRAPALQLRDVYAGFDLWTILSGKYEVKKIKLTDGHIHVSQDSAGNWNLLNAIAPTEPSAEEAAAAHFDLKRIEIKRVQVTQADSRGNPQLTAGVKQAKARIKTDEAITHLALKTQFALTLFQNGDTTFIHDKQISIDTGLDYEQTKQFLTIQPSEIRLGEVAFSTGGTLDVKNDLDIDLNVKGQKPSFDLFLAFAPPELEPVLKRYENKGEVFFEAAIKGKAGNGSMPGIEARFGCRDAFIQNAEVKKKLDELQFEGFFTNGEKRDLTTMELRIKDFSAKPDAGTFTGDLVVKNFESPEIDLKLTSDFELEFLAKFFNINDLRGLQGKVFITMNFHDIIDLEHPERAIEKLNESYFSKLKVENLQFSSPKFGAPIHDFDLDAEVEGSEARISRFHLVAGRSDLDLSGYISDLPAIIHHTSAPVTTELTIRSKFLDVFELTGSDSLTSFNEQISNLSLGLSFKCAANAFTESPNLPVGEFFIDNLNASLRNYPHTLHDFHADVVVDTQDFRVIDFKGMIDETDFFFSGNLRHYDLWFEEVPRGDTRLEFDLTASVIRFKDLFTYQGVNYVPEDYRHEEIRNFRLHGVTDLHFKDTLHSIDLILSKFSGKMKIHPLAFEQFQGRVHFENANLTVENFSGKLGQSDFRTSLNYFVGKDEARKSGPNKFSLTANRLNFDELFAFNLPPQRTGMAEVQNHDSAFNIYQIPFPDMAIDMNIGQLKYDAYLIQNLRFRGRTTRNHYLYADSLHLEAAGGAFDLKGYFNGSDPSRIYLSHELRFRKVDLDKLFLKFDNFGQDYLVSENLHGILTGSTSGIIEVHPDLVPKLETADLKIRALIEKGRLENYALFEYMADFFKDKNLNNVRFDTLENEFQFKNGTLIMPAMTINSSIGFMEISGQQDLNLNMDYTLRLPWRLVTDAAASKLFGRKADEVDPGQEDAIQYADPEKKIRFLTLRVTGTPDDYKITPVKGRNAR